MEDRNNPYVSNRVWLIKLLVDCLGMSISDAKEVVKMGSRTWGCYDNADRAVYQNNMKYIVEGFILSKASLKDGQLRIDLKWKEI